MLITKGSTVMVEVSAITGEGVAGLLDALELERATFVGHDWGAL